MRLKEVLSGTWKDYKQNFWLYTKIMLLFFALPFIIFLALRIWIFGFSTKMGNNEMVFIIISTLSFILLNVFLSASIIASSLFNKKKFSEAIGEGKKYFWKYLGFSIVVFVFIYGLLLLLVFIFGFSPLLIVPGIIFMVYWAFASFVFIGERKSIIESLRKSFHIIRGRWWKTLGYYFVFLLIVILIILIISIIEVPTSVYLFIDLFKNPELYKNGIELTTIGKFHSVVSYLSFLIQNIIIVPLSILFTKNFYLLARKEKRH